MPRLQLVIQMPPNPPEGPAPSCNNGHARLADRIIRETLGGVAGSAFGQLFSAPRVSQRNRHVGLMRRAISRRALARGLFWLLAIREADLLPG
jgi:hypothetical protein